MKQDVYSIYLTAIQRSLANMDPVPYKTHAELAASALGAIDAQSLKVRPVSTEGAADGEDLPLADPRSREELERHVAALTK